MAGEKERAQDDLFRHVNGSWIEQTQIPDDKPRWGSFDELAEGAISAVRDLLDDSSLRAKIPLASSLYASFMNTERVESRGVDPVVQILAEVYALDTWESFTAWSQANFARIGTLPVAAGVYNDLDRPDFNTLHLSQGGLFLPDESYYRLEQHRSVREKYTELLQKLLDKFGYGDAAALDEFCAQIAELHWDVAKNRNVDLTHNPMPFAKACALGSSLQLDAYFNIGADVVVDVAQPDFIEGIAELWSQEYLPQWKNWLLCCVATHYASYLNQEVDDLGFALTQLFSGATKQRERYKRGVALTGLVGDELGKVYVERHYDEASRAKMQEMIEYLIKAYRVSIEKAAWLSETTKGKALEKLSQFDAQIGFPKHWHCYEGVELSEDLLSNLDALKRFHFEDELAKVGERVDKLLWHMTPQTVNAYYNPPENVIVFPAAILQEPFFASTRESSANYGGIGAVIGHEIGHGFDDQGSKYNGAGELEDWWTSQDNTKFKELTTRLNAQFEAFTPEQLAQEKTPPHVNGALTTGENVGDLSGIKIALLAYALSRGVESIEELIALDEEAVRKFFYSYAEIWRNKARDEYVRLTLTVDPHSPAEFRANTVRNLDAFHSVFGTQAGDRLWLEPEDRIDIW